MEPKDATFLVWDHGLMLPLAIELAKTAKRVLYYNAAQIDAFPTLNKCIIGDGYDNLQIIQVPEDPWDYKNETDCFVFPDLLHGGAQLELESQGRLVWGSRHGDRMEMLRGQFLKALEKNGLEVPEHGKFSLSELRRFLQDKEDFYIKISKFRGSMETHHHRNMEQDSCWFDLMALKFGPFQNKIILYAFPSIPTDVEVGCDTYCIDGAYPYELLVGYEMKDRSYFGAVTDAAALPMQLLEVNQAFRQELTDHRYRNFISSEVRIKGDHFYFIDPTRRAGVPSGLSQFKLYRNLPEIILAGAQGELVQPEMKAQFSCECVMTAKGEKSCWTVVDFPEELRDSIGCPNSCQDEQRICWPPDDSGDHEIGWLHEMADTPKACIQGMLDKAAELPDGVTAATDSLADLLKEIESGKSQGVPFSSKPMPEPSVVVEQPTT